MTRTEVGRQMAEDGRASTKYKENAKAAICEGSQQFKEQARVDE